ncbi:MAG: HAMP domain-containing protein [Steroidobacteraceae bacterium]
MTRPIGVAVRAAEAIAQGDLTQRIEAGASDETGQLLRALGNTVEQLRGIVANVQTATDSVAPPRARSPATRPEPAQRGTGFSLEETASSWRN